MRFIIATIAATLAIAPAAAQEPVPLSFKVVIGSSLGPTCGFMVNRPRAAEVARQSGASREELVTLARIAGQTYAEAGPVERERLCAIARQLAAELRFLD